MNWTTRPIRVAGTLLLAVAVAACSDGAETAQGMPAQGQLPEGHPPLEGSSPYAHQQQAAPAGPAAVVLETQDVTGYTYARVESEGEEIWVAGPTADLAVGDTIGLGGAMGMTNFTSNELGRTFENILFLQAWAPPAPREPGANRGEVLEVIATSSYSYIRVTTEDGDVWLAGPRVAVEEGQTVAWGDGMPMENFESNTLDRTFDVLWFVDRVDVVE